MCNKSVLKICIYKTVIENMYKVDFNMICPCWCITTIRHNIQSHATECFIIYFYSEMCRLVVEPSSVLHVDKKQKMLTAKTRITLLCTKRVTWWFPPDADAANPGRILITAFRCLPPVFYVYDILLVLLRYINQITQRF